MMALMDKAQAPAVRPALLRLAKDYPQVPSSVCVVVVGGGGGDVCRIAQILKEQASAVRKTHSGKKDPLCYSWPRTIHRYPAIYVVMVLMVVVVVVGDGDFVALP